MVAVFRGPHVAKRVLRLYIYARRLVVCLIGQAANCPMFRNFCPLAPLVVLIVSWYPPPPGRRQARPAARPPNRHLRAGDGMIMMMTIMMIGIRRSN